MDLTQAKMIARLIAVGGPLQGHSFALPESEGRIGRAATNWLSINHPTISREHCLLRATESGWQVIDLESHNGTLVNDEPVHERLLGSRDHYAGHVSLRFRFGAPLRENPRGNSQSGMRRDLA